MERLDTITISILKWGREGGGVYQSAVITAAFFVMRASLKSWESRSVCRHWHYGGALHRVQLFFVCLFVLVRVFFLLLLLFLATSYCFSWDVYVATWGFGEAWCEGNIISEHDLARFQRQNHRWLSSPPLVLGDRVPSSGVRSKLQPVEAALFIHGQVAGRLFSQACLSLFERLHLTFSL